MQANILPAAAGIHWLKLGFLLFLRDPARLALASMLYWMLLITASSIPALGFIASSLVLPFVSIAASDICRAADIGSPRQGFWLDWSRSWRTRLVVKRLCLIGLANGLSVALSFGLAGLLSGQSAFPLMTQDGSDATYPTLLKLMAIAFVLQLPMAAAIWFANPLIAWHQLATARALFYSFVGCWRNWRAFLLYSLTLLTILVWLPALLQQALLLIVTGLGVVGAGQRIVAVVPLAIILLAIPILFAGFYVSYRQIYGPATGDSLAKESH